MDFKDLRIKALKRKTKDRDVPLPKKAGYFTKLGELYEHKGKDWKARGAYEAAIKHYDELVSAWETLGTDKERRVIDPYDGRADNLTYLRESRQYFQNALDTSIKRYRLFKKTNPALAPDNPEDPNNPPKRHFLFLEDKLSKLDGLIRLEERLESMDPKERQRALEKLRKKRELRRKNKKNIDDNFYPTFMPTNNYNDGATSISSLSGFSNGTFTLWVLGILFLISFIIMGSKITGFMILDSEMGGIKLEDIVLTLAFIGIFGTLVVLKKKIRLNE